MRKKKHETGQLIDNDDNDALVDKNSAASPGDDGEDKSGTGTQTLVKPLVKPGPHLSEPVFYKVILLNDDFTPMDFVVHVLLKFFNRTGEDANRIMMQVHQHGSGVAGVYSHEIAETKVYLVNDYARKSKHPLKCAMEKM